MIAKLIQLALLNRLASLKTALLQDAVEYGYDAEHTKLVIDGIDAATNTINHYFDTL